MDNSNETQYPITYENPWFQFVEEFNNLPYKRASGQLQKSKMALSRFFKSGLVLSATVSSTNVALRLTFSTNMNFLVDPVLIRGANSLGWLCKEKAPDQLLFRMDLPADTDPGAVAAKFIPMLTYLGVPPNQDWGN